MLCTSAGPKLRKWYGEGELPTDAERAVVERMPEPEDVPDEQVVQDAVLVTDADSATGEQVVLQLILSRYEMIEQTSRSQSHASRLHDVHCTSCLKLPKSLLTMHLLAQVASQDHHTRCRRS